MWQSRCQRSGPSSSRSTPVTAQSLFSNQQMWASNRGPVVDLARVHDEGERGRDISSMARCTRAFWHGQEMCEALGDQTLTVQHSARSCAGHPLGRHGDRWVPRADVTARSGPAADRGYGW